MNLSKNQYDGKHYRLSTNSKVMRVFKVKVIRKNKWVKLFLIVRNKKILLTL